MATRVYYTCSITTVDGKTQHHTLENDDNENDPVIIRDGIKQNESEIGQIQFLFF